MFPVSRLQKFLLLLSLLAFLMLKVCGSSLLESIFGRGALSWSDARSKWSRPMKQVDENLMKMIGYSDKSYHDDFNATLSEILIPRVPGTAGHKKVEKHILKEMNDLGWEVEEDIFTSPTPYGPKNFANIIATADPKACDNLVIACHYDSKYNREFTFMGAVDSAVPCAMMIHAAKLLNPLLKKSAAKGSDVTLQLIFFDGEEAFDRWSSTDSLYGSRHLAKKWKSRAPFSEMEGSGCKGRTYSSYIDRMNVMVLLDLIGSANPKFYSYFPDTHNLYMQFANAEKKLNQLNLLDNQGSSIARNKYFSSTFRFGGVEDDHVPFEKNGVPIVHLIPNPFPPVWHKESDNLRNVDHPTVDNLNKILRLFIVQYLNLDTPEKPLTLH